MRRKILVDRLLTFAACAALAAAAHAGGRTRELARTFEIERDQVVSLDLSVGEMRVEGADIDQIEAELQIECRWGSDADCERLLERVELESRTTSRRRIVEIVTDSSWRKTKLEIEGIFRVPRGAALEVDMGVGELEIEGVEANLTVDLGVGETRIHFPAAKVGRVSLDVGVGEAELFGADSHVEGRRSLLIGSEVYWAEGKGEARVRADVGVGEITVWLE